MAAAALELPNLPHIVGRYVLYGAIASGGMATVHFGRLVGPGGFARPVAIKRLHAQYARDPEFVEMFLDEARLAARIAHPNVVQTIDLVETADEVFLVMDYVRGLALSSLVRILRGNTVQRIPPAVSLGIVVGILEGLHAAHEAKDDMGDRLDLVHRDVSPQNILVGTDGIARLLDFGIAKAARRSQSTRDGQLKGKMAYMSPEQIHGTDVTRQTDIYAASVVLWEILTGKRLFYGNTDAESLKRALNDEVQPPSSIIPDVPVALDRVVLKGLERDKSKRYSTAHEMALELSACLTPAQPAEIGQWVERSAAHELNERATRVAAIERSAAESLSQLRLVPPGQGAPDAPTPVGKRTLDPVVDQALVATATALGDTGMRARGELSPSRARRLVPVVLGAALLAGVAALAVHAGGSAQPLAATAPPAASSAAATPPASAPRASSDRDWSQVPAAPPVVPPFDPSAQATPPTPQPSATPVAKRSSSSEGSSSSKGTSSTSSSPSTHGGTKPGCDPPYTEDAQGHVHFKPSCL